MDGSERVLRAIE